MSFEHFDELLRRAPTTSNTSASLHGKVVEDQGAVLRVSHVHPIEPEPMGVDSVNLAIASHTNDGRAETLELVEKFIERTGWHPDRVELIAGALNYSRYNFLIRFVMRSIARKAGGDTDTSRDYEYTDWSAVDRFAVGVAEGPEVASAGFPVPPAQVAPQATTPRAP